MAFPIAEAIKLVAAIASAANALQPEHAAVVESVTAAAEAHDVAQDARIQALEKRVASLEKSFDLVVKANQLARARQ